MRFLPNRFGRRREPREPDTFAATESFHADGAAIAANADEIAEINGGEVAEGSETVTLVSDISQLPGYTDVLTLPGKPYQLGDTVRKKLAAVSTKANILVLATPDAYNKAEHLSLVQRIKHGVRGKTPIESIQVRGSVLLMLHDKQLGPERRIKVDRKAGQEAETIVMFTEYASRAARIGASDLHFVIKKDSNSGAVLVRQHGSINLIDRVPYQDLLDAVGAAYTNLAEDGTRSEPTFNAKAMQSCRIPMTVDNREFKLRWQSAPISGGVHVALRLLGQEAPGQTKKESLLDQGYAPSQVRLLDLAVRKTFGVIFVSGPTGSGKSTLLKSLMMYSEDRLSRISWSIEDPVEYKMFGVSQVSVQRSITDTSDENPFLPAMRMVLRADPDTILVGEVRDKESLSLLKLMVLSGHAVMSSLHASNSTGVVERLVSEELGLSRQTLSTRDFLSAVVYQQLVPKLCPCCKLPAEEHLSDEYKAILTKKFGMDLQTIRVRNPDGCSECEGKGVKGRTVVAEVNLPDHEYLSLVRSGDDTGAEEYWRSTRFATFTEPDCTGKTALEHGLYKVHCGLVDPVDLEKSFVPYAVHTVIPLKVAA
jgi:type II secretory ATPase GspE/PulE/Tfp pilus assembly ATPase PilB-like protein